MGRISQPARFCNLEKQVDKRVIEAEAIIDERFEKVDREFGMPNSKYFDATEGLAHVPVNSPKASPTASETFVPMRPHRTLFPI